MIFPNELGDQALRESTTEQSLKSTLYKPKVSQFTMHVPSLITKLTAVLVLATVAVKAQTKPYLFEDSQIRPITDALAGYVTPVGATWEQWPAGMFPSACVSEAQSGNKCTTAQLKVYSVTYNDCTQPWVMCRCDTARVSLERMIEMFGRVPVKSRVYIRHMFSWPDVPGIAAYTFGPDIGLTSLLQNSQGQDDMNAILHETGHVLDGAFGGVSSSAAFLNAIQTDSCVLRSYSQTSPAEGLGDLNVFVWFSKINPTEYQNVYNQWGMSCLANQMNFMQSTFGAVNVPGGTCPPRVNPNSPTVWLKRSRSAIPKAEDGPPAWRKVEDGPPSWRRDEEGPPAWREVEDGPPSWRRDEDGPPAWREVEDGPPSWRRDEVGPPAWRKVEDGPPSWRRYEDAFHYFD